MPPCQLRVRSQIKTQLDRLQSQLDDGAPTRALDFIDGYLDGLREAGGISSEDLKHVSDQIIAMLRAAAEKSRTARAV